MIFFLVIKEHNSDEKKGIKYILTIKRNARGRDKKNNELISEACSWIIFFFCNVILIFLIICSISDQSPSFIRSNFLLDNLSRKKFL